MIYLFFIDVTYIGKSMRKVANGGVLRLGFAFLYSAASIHYFNPDTR
jgi:hypothetical protein